MLALLMLALLVLALATAAPSIATQIRRQREKEMVFRAQQYVVAIQRYYHKFGAYPPNLDRLKQTNGMHFLRHAWPDPLTRSGKWFFIHYGQVTVSGPAAGPGRAGGPAGNTNNPGAPANPFSMSAGGFGPSLTGSAAQKKKAGFGACKRRGRNAGSTLGGGPIIGVASRDNRPAILNRDGKDLPCEWAFVYDPGKDRTLHVLAPAVAPPGGMPGGMPPIGGILSTPH